MSTIAWDRAEVDFAATTPSIVDADLVAGELCLVAGPTASGKSALLRTVNGALPHSRDGRLRGHVHTVGRDVAAYPPRRFADAVASVPARPADFFIATTVEDEVGHALARKQLTPAARSRRIDELLGSLGIAELRSRPIAALSTGQQQRVAVAGALAAEPEVLVLDEPLAALDPAGAEAVIRLTRALSRSHGTTVVLAAHRAEQIMGQADSVLYVPGDGEPARHGDPRQLLPGTPAAPPILDLSTLLGWRPAALTVAEALDAALRHPLPDPEPDGGPAEVFEPVLSRDEVVCRARGLSVRLGPLGALRRLDLTVSAGEIVAVTGGNGAGKSSLLAAAAGLLRPVQGRIEVGGVAPARLRGTDRLRRVGLLPADPGELLLADRVDRECETADREGRVPPGRTAFLLDALLPGVARHQHPRTLSTGEQQALALAIVLARGPRLILFDEPARGLDYPARRRLALMLRQLVREGHAVLVATHDDELMAELATRVVALTDGELTDDRPIGEALARGLVSTQVGQIMAPAPLHTVADVRRELAS